MLLESKLLPSHDKIKCLYCWFRGLKRIVVAVQDADTEVDLPSYPFALLCLSSSLAAFLLSKSAHEKTDDRFKSFDLISTITP